MLRYLDSDRKQELLCSVEAYIAQHYIAQRRSAFGKNAAENRMLKRCGRKGISDDLPQLSMAPTPEASQPAEDDWGLLEHGFPKERKQQVCAKDTLADDRISLEDLIEEAEKEETFSRALLRIIQEKQLTEPEVYNSVFMDRKLFNKIRNTPEYQPSKRTALLLAIALKLDLDQTRDFIGKAGFQLVHWNKFDVILEYFIVNGNYDVFEINEMLSEFKMPLLLRCD